MIRKKTLSILGITVFCVITIVTNLTLSTDTSNTIPNQIEKDVPDNLTFSNTQQWDPQLLDLLHTPLILVPDFINSFQLTLPPSNTSSTTRSELAHLHQLAKQRTTEQYTDILQHIAIEAVPFGSSTFSELTSSTTRPHTNVLLNTVHTEFVPIILHYKKKFDRVRPSALDHTLTTLIPVPNHPAYPSGHAAESYLFALVFSDIDPDQSIRYFESAQTIAHEREIAGVHYPSDSAAGVALAEQFFFAIKNTTWYIQEREKAREEW